MQFQLQFGPDLDHANYERLVIFVNDVQFKPLTIMANKISVADAQKTKSGKIDKRTKEGKAICERMAKARKSKNSLKNRIKRLFK